MEGEAGKCTPRSTEQKNDKSHQRRVHYGDRTSSTLSHSQRTPAVLDGLFCQLKPSPNRSTKPAGVPQAVPAMSLLNGLLCRQSSLLLTP
mmetsp:Transcript_43927/g.78932  ORF Transcript_43927/g.78932 Transcript_43927/m.78932 type:complete len:90 (-) Transcript_43927:234-503(-)